MDNSSRIYDPVKIGLAVAIAGIACAKMRWYGSYHPSSHPAYYRNRSFWGRSPWWMPFKIRYWAITGGQLVGLAGMYLLMREIGAPMWGKVTPTSWVTVVGWAFALWTWSTAECMWLGFQSPEMGVGMYALALMVGLVSLALSTMEFGAWTAFAVSIVVPVILCLCALDPIADLWRGPLVDPPDAAEPPQDSDDDADDDDVTAEERIKES